MDRRDAASQNSADQRSHIAAGHPEQQASAALMLMIGGDRLAREVHAAWFEGMLMQGRDVAPERRAWDTLSDQDKELDKYIGDRLEAIGGRGPSR